MAKYTFDPIDESEFGDIQAYEPKYTFDTSDEAEVEWGQNLEAEKSRAATGALRNLAQGATYAFADEAEAGIRSLFGDTSYGEELDKIRAEMDEYSTLNPKAALFQEIGAGVLTAGGVAKAATKYGGKEATAAGIGGAEGIAYGVGSGESFEERAAMGAAGGVLGMGIGKVIDIATSPKGAGGIKTPEDEAADAAIPDGAGDALKKSAAKAEADAQYTNAAGQNQDVIPLAEAKTAGELYTGMKKAFTDFYDNHLRGISDTLMDRVSPEIGARYQRVSETAMRESNKLLGRYFETLPPILTQINNSNAAKGALLDYAAGKYGKTMTEGLSKLREALSEAGIEDSAITELQSYIAVSAKRNAELNRKVFGATFAEDQAYLHTRITTAKRDKIAQGLDDDTLPIDRAFEARTRGAYFADAVDPLDYDNPIVSDMQRLFELEQLFQIQRMYGVDIGPAVRAKSVRALNEDGTLPADAGQRRALTPDEFLDQMRYTFEQKGINPAASKQAMDLIKDDILGQAKSPHPWIQALNSFAYATTLAGPMSALLNLADIPLVGAKYGGRGVAAGAREMGPGIRQEAQKAFRSLPKTDLEKMGLSPQHVGEFVNNINNELNATQSLAGKTATIMREGTNWLMRKSGFAAMDVVGKRGVMKGALGAMAEQVAPRAKVGGKEIPGVDKAGVAKFKRDWGFYFREPELDAIVEQLSKHGNNWKKYDAESRDVMEELAFAALGQQQLISSAGRPAGWARNPNLRPLWALRGFVIKQQALALREVVGNLKAGRPKEAAEFLGRYALYGAGGYAVINEGRQFLFGDGNASASGLVQGYGDAWASLLTMNTLGLNDYQYGKIMQNGVALTALEGLMPIAVDRPIDIGARVIGAIDGKDYGREVVQDALPFVKQTARAIRNAGGEYSFGSGESISPLTPDISANPAELSKWLLERKPTSSQ